MSGTVTTATIYAELKPTLDSIVTDKSDGLEAKAIMPKLYKQSSQTDLYDDDAEIAWTGGYAAEKEQGANIVLGAIKQGGTTRYLLRTFARSLRVTEEAQKFNKYPEAIDAAARLKRVLWQTVDFDATGMFIHGFDTGYVPGPDGLPLYSASHTLVDGGTFSNLGSALTPSKMAVALHRTQAMKMPGHDGLPGGVDLMKVTFPVDQWDTWSGLTNSTHDPSAGAFNEINVINHDMNLERVPNKYWRNTTTNYAYITDAENGFKWKWGWKPTGRTWVQENTMSIMHAQSGNWARSCSNFRATIGVNA